MSPDNHLEHLLNEIIVSKNPWCHPPFVITELSAEETRVIAKEKGERAREIIHPTPLPFRNRKST